MSDSKTITPLSIHLIKHHTSLQFSEVISRLNNETKKPPNVINHNTPIISRIRSARYQNELESVVDNNIGPSGFLYFQDTEYHHLIEKAIASQRKTQLKLVVYTIGNPLIAQSILQYNSSAALNVPIRLLITEKPNNAGTTVAYYLPSSTMFKTHSNLNDSNLEERIDNLEIEKQIKMLDEKLDMLVSRVTAD